MRYYLERCPHSVVFATSLNDLYNNHKINFDGSNIGAGNTRHTSLDWFLAPSDRPSIDKAPLKEHYIDIPGTNGGLDLTESLTGFPLYDYIEGEIEFDILNERKLPILDNNFNLINEKEISWEVLNRDIRSFLNGKERYMMFEDDPSWYYKGRFGVEKYDSSDDSHSKITISYKVYPYKRLSTYIYNYEPNRVFFDTISLGTDDVAQLMISFRDKTQIKFYPGDTKTWNGNVENKLPCGEEAVPIAIDVAKDGNGLVLKLTLKKGEETTERTVEFKDGEDFVIVRGAVLTNKTSKGALYSDDKLTLSLDLPAIYDQTKSYKKGESVSYTSVQENINWVLKAKEDIAANTTFNTSMWDIDECMKVVVYSSSKSYTAYQQVAYVLPDSITFMIAKHDISADTEFNLEDWEINVTSLTIEDIYNPYLISVKYDIGVM